MICAWVPARVRVPVPFAPALIVAPPARLTVTVPLPTVSAVVARLPSTSVTESPLIDSAVSSLTVCAPGTVFTGASFTAATVSVTVCVALGVAPSLATTVIDRLLVVGVSLVSL